MNGTTLGVIGLATIGTVIGAAQLGSKPEPPVVSGPIQTASVPEPPVIVAGPMSKQSPLPSTLRPGYPAHLMGDGIPRTPEQAAYFARTLQAGIGDDLVGVDQPFYFSNAPGHDGIAYPNPYYAP